MKKSIFIRSAATAFLCLVLFNYTLANTPKAEGYKVGDQAISFQLKNVDGKMVSPADYQSAKGFIVIFTCNTCPYSKLYESRIEALNQKYASKGYPVLAINSNDMTKQPGDSFEEMVKTSNAGEYSFPYLYDESQEIATAYGATKTPHVYVLEKNKKNLQVKYIGAIDNNARDEKSATDKYVENAVDALLANKPVSTTSTKAIGCTIKWKEA
ncbi:thioredoxin family protein [Reichenbachiella agariperforans]|uniref:thioredoxin family protein n=1 Tax=Reichenbachiella agariperforans TaxID=156994 RepID=UPI001C09D3FB|nr:thioredoxin family protein [Reichenbachiella agariperforans]MBU2915280.1 thioredoxin family protein [Reichenbachiella agariperforans]